MSGTVQRRGVERVLLRGGQVMPSTSTARMMQIATDLEEGSGIYTSAESIRLVTQQRDELVTALELAKQQLEFRAGIRKKSWDGNFLAKTIDAALSKARGE